MVTAIELCVVNSIDNDGNTGFSGPVQLPLGALPVLG